MNLKEKVKKLGSQKQMAKFLGINHMSLCRNLANEKFNSIAVNMVIDLLLGDETEKSLKKKFNSLYVKPKRAGRKTQIERTTKIQM